MKTYIYNIHINFNKTLHIGHLYSLMYADMVYKGLKITNPEVCYLYNRLDLDVSDHFLNFAIFLENKYKKQIKNLDPISIGKKYVDYKKSGVTISDSQLIERRKHVEISPKNHPIHDILIPEWEKVHTYLSMYNPGFNTLNKYKITKTDFLKLISKNGYVLDKRSVTGNIFIDLTQYGIPLRSICGENIYEYNYVFVILRSIISSSKIGDKIILIGDNELAGDVLIIEKILQSLGYLVQKKLIKKIMYKGETLSTREGKWIDVTAFKLIQKYSNIDRKLLSLALRLYFLPGINRENSDNFTFDNFEKHILRVKDLLTQIDFNQKVPPEMLKTVAGSTKTFINYENPNSVASVLFANKTDRIIKSGLAQNIFF